MAKIKIGGMMQSTGLVQMGVMSVPDRLGGAVVAMQETFDLP
jgi:hypothetical protein